MHIHWQVTVTRQECTFPVSIHGDLVPGECGKPLSNFWDGPLLHDNLFLRIVLSCFIHYFGLMSV